MKLLTAKNSLQTLVAVQVTGKLLFISYAAGEFAKACYDYSTSTDEKIIEFRRDLTLKRPLIAVDPVDKTVLVIPYTGVFTFCKWSDVRWEECEFFHTTRERNEIIDVDFVQTTGKVSNVVYLMRRNCVIHVCHASYNVAKRRFKLLKCFKVQHNFRQVHALPYPADGYLLVSSTKLAFESLSQKIRRVIEDIHFKTSYKFNGVLDHKRAFFVDVNDRVVILKLGYGDDDIEFQGGKVDYLKQNDDIIYVNVVYQDRLVVQNRKRQPAYANLVKMQDGRYAIRFDGEPRPTNSPRQHFYVGQRVKNRFTLLEQLGSGPTGTTYLVEDNIDPLLLYVLKVIEPEMEATYHKECSALGVCFADPGVVEILYAFELTRNLCFVMPFAGDSINVLLRRKEPDFKLTTENTIRIGYAVMKAVAGIHHNGFFHRDLNGEKVLISFADTRKPVVKIVGFGCSADFLDEQNQRIPIAGKSNWRVARNYSELDDMTDVIFLLLTMKNITVPVLDSGEGKELTLDFSQVTLPEDCAWIETFYDFAQSQRTTGYNPKSLLKGFNSRNTGLDVDPKSPMNFASCQVLQQELVGEELQETVKYDTIYFIE